MIFVKFFISVASLCLVNGSLHQLPDTIRPTTDENTQEQAALTIIRRVIGDKADDVTVKINFDLPGNSFKVKISKSKLRSVPTAVDIPRIDCIFLKHRLSFR